MQRENRTRDTKAIKCKFTNVEWNRVERVKERQKEIDKCIDERKKKHSQFQFLIQQINVRRSSFCVTANVERKLKSDHYFDEKKLKKKRKKNEEIAIKTCSQPNFSLFFRRLR